MDIINNYKKNKKISNLSIIWISLILAFWINFLVINNTNITKNLKTSVLENQAKNDLWDVYLEKNWNDVYLKSNGKINNIINLALSISYNPENISIEEIIPKYNAEISNISNVEWLSTIMLDYSESNNINSSEKILTIKINKKENKTENINIISANFTDSENNIFELSTSWVSF